MLSALMSCRGYFELGIGDVSSEYKVSVKQFQISGGGEVICVPILKLSSLGLLFGRPKCRMSAN